jgi:putative addiction module component (TIGR02574 family)
MDIATTLNQIKTLNLDDRIKLVQAIWDTIAEDQADMELTDAEKQEFDRRIAEHDADSDNVLTWEELKANIKNKK